MNISELINIAVEAHINKTKSSKLSVFSAHELSKNSKPINSEKALRHVRLEAGHIGEYFTDKSSNNDLVAFYMTNARDNNEVWLEALVVLPNYRGLGLSPQLLDRMIKKFKVTHLSVNKKNELAIKIYLDNGFKTYQETNAMLFMRRE